MKTSVALTLACVASASAFAPQQAPVRQTTELNALFNKIFDLDLFAPKADQNDYGARNKKTVSDLHLTLFLFIASHGLRMIGSHCVCFHCFTPTACHWKDRSQLLCSQRIDRPTVQRHPRRGGQQEGCQLPKERSQGWKVPWI